MHTKQIKKNLNVSSWNPKTHPPKIKYSNTNQMNCSAKKRMHCQTRWYFCFPIWDYHQGLSINLLILGSKNFCHIIPDNSQYFRRKQKVDFLPAIFRIFAIPIRYYSGFLLFCCESSYQTINIFYENEQ